MKQREKCCGSSNAHVAAETMVIYFLPWRFGKGNSQFTVGWITCCVEYQPVCVSFDWREFKIYCLILFGQQKFVAGRSRGEMRDDIFCFGKRLVVVLGRVNIAKTRSFENLKILLEKIVSPANLRYNRMWERRNNFHWVSFLLNRELNTKFE